MQINVNRAQKQKREKVSIGLVEVTARSRNVMLLFKTNLKHESY